MPDDQRVSQVPIHTISAPPARLTCEEADISPSRRWGCCRISADVASALDIPLDRLRNGDIFQIRICVTQADVNVLYNPGYVEFLGKSDSFVIEGLAGGSHRVEIHGNSGPGAKDGGVFKLFGGGSPFTGSCIPTNARVSLCREHLFQAAAV